MRKSILLFAAISFFCFLCNIEYAQAPDWLWAKSAGGTNSEGGDCVVVDASGNVYVTGYFNSPTIVFGSYTLTNAGSYDVFLVKYNASGNVLWATSAGGTDDDEGSSLALDASGNVYVTGYFKSSTLIFGSYTLTNAGTSNNDIFLAKYDANGNVLWAKSAGGTDNDYGISVAVDASGDVYLTGWFDSPAITFGSYTLTNVSAGSGDIYLVKYDMNGNVLWAKSAGSTGDDGASCVAVDASGELYMTGWFASPTINFGSYTLTNVGFYDVFLVKYDTSGNVLWAKSAGGTDYDETMGVASDSSGNAYVTGYFNSPAITFGSYTLTSMGSFDEFLVKYDASGNVLWAKSAGGTDFDDGNSVALDASGDIYVTGEFVSPTITFGSYTLTNAGSSSSDMYFVKYDASGNVLWAKGAGGTDYDNGNSVALDASGNSYVTGWFESPTITFGSDTLTNVNAGSEDIFLAKIKGSTTGIIEINNSLNISVFPNPATDRITVEISGEMVGSNLSILNVEGQQLINRQITESKTQLDISALPSSVYFVRVTNNRTVKVGKFVKE
jgi:alpha-tubulin suppressor-like RCC1 family protein